jgi:hypothetical protein
MFQAITEQVLTLFSEIVTADVSLDQLPDLLSAERALEGWSRECARAMLQQFLRIRAEQSKASRGHCKCGKSIPLHSESSWPRHGTLGTVQVADPYCYCRKCGQQARPLHALLGSARETWSLDAERLALDLASDESCEKAVKKLARLRPELQMGRTTALRLLHAHGERAREFIQEKIGYELNQAKARTEQTGGVAELEVEYDEGMIPTAVLELADPVPGQPAERTAVRGLPKRKRVCEWKGAKVGLVQIPGETTRLYTARPTYELEPVFNDLLGLASMKGWAGNTQVRGIADGAPYIRPRMERVFDSCPFKFILDRPHAKAHLHAAAERLHPGDQELRDKWENTAMNELESGHAEKVIAQLRQKAAEYEDDELRKAADYFERNKDAVAYAEYRAKGWSTASSEVESSHRHVVQVRLKIAGAWWHPDKVGNILALRVLKCNEGWWDEYWQRQDEKWKQRALSYRQPERRVA